jgi:hypothetical protein
MSKPKFLKRLILIPLAVALANCGAADPPKPSGARQQPGGVAASYAGGVAGINDLANPANSANYRAAGGGLYLHGRAWNKLDDHQKRQILSAFRGAPVGVETGWGVGGHVKAWAKQLKEKYLDYGIRPDFIAVNAFAGNNRPTPGAWKEYVDAMRAVGLPTSTHVLPTFEYQNFKSNIKTLRSNTVSSSPDFQEIIQAAGGLVMDTPPRYSMHREQAYRDWVTDAIQWANSRGLVSVVILSPWNSGKRWNEDTRQYLEYLGSHNAVPTALVCENYANPELPNYPNPVGNERDPSTALGNCRAVQQKRR